MRGGPYVELVLPYRNARNALFTSPLELSLSSARFLKTVRCRHRNGPLVVKIFIKPDPGVSLHTFHRRLKGRCNDIYRTCPRLTLNLLCS